MKAWCVRIVQTKTTEGDYCHEGGIIGDNWVGVLIATGRVTPHNTDSRQLTTLCLDLEVGKQERAEKIADKMRKMGFNAVAAPSTK